MTEQQNAYLNNKSLFGYHVRIPQGFRVPEVTPEAGTLFEETLKMAEERKAQLHADLHILIPASKDYTGGITCKELENTLRQYNCPGLKFRLATPSDVSLFCMRYWSYCGKPNGTYMCPAELGGVFAFLVKDEQGRYLLIGGPIDEIGGDPDERLLPNSKIGGTVPLIVAEE